MYKRAATSTQPNSTAKRRHLSSSTPMSDPSPSPPLESPVYVKIVNFANLDNEGFMPNYRLLVDQVNARLQGIGDIVESDEYTVKPGATDTVITFPLSTDLDLLRFETTVDAHFFAGMLTANEELREQVGCFVMHCVESGVLRYFPPAVEE
jgi:hypothetical protein